MNPQQLFFVRYAPGAAGNFLISLLQTSEKLVHWNAEVEQSKKSANFKQIFLNRFYYNYQKDLYNHIKVEPHHPYNLDFISATHPRGDNFSFTQFIEQLAKRKDLMLTHLQQNKKPVLRLNKPNIPLFAQGSSVVNIIVDPLSVKWLNRIRFVKLFGYTDGIGISKENHPEFLKAKYKKILFNNQYQFHQSKYSFIKHKVINDPWIKSFFSSTTLLQHQTNKHCNHYNVNLSDLIDPKKTKHAISKVFEHYKLGLPDLDLVDICAKHFYNSNVKPFCKIL
tara:strand:- start:22299 stop:23138 length:840 start_codon:yes stop_codon:yes gene_type:complete